MFEDAQAEKTMYNRHTDNLNNQETLAHLKKPTLNIALCRSWKTGFKVVNFEQLFIHQFWTKMSQIFNDDV